MPSSQSQTLQNKKLSPKEASQILSRTLDKAKGAKAPAILIVEFPSEAVRRQAEELLAASLQKVSDTLFTIDLRQSVNLLQTLEDMQPDQVASVYGIHAQPEVVRQLNWGRERLTDNNKRVVFWLNSEELKDLSTRAPDFWAFRNRYLQLEPQRNKNVQIEPKDYHQTSLELSRMSGEAKQNRIEALKELLQNLKDQKSERAQTLRNNLGQLYWETGRYKKAIEYYEQAIEITREILDRRNEGSLLSNLGNAYFNLGEIRKAIDYYEQALIISREVQNRRNQVNHLGNLGNAYRDLGEARKSIDYYEQSLEITKKIQDRQGESNCLGNLGNAYFDLGEVVKAIKYYEQALEISRKIQDIGGESTWLGNLGNAYRNLGEVSKAIQYYEQALKISKEIQDGHGEGIWLGNLGIAYRDLGEVSKAIQYYEQALQIDREFHHRSGEAMQLWYLGIAYSDLKEFKKALACYIVSYDLMKKVEKPYIKKLIDHIKSLRDTEPAFETLLRSLFPSGDSILNTATKQNYTFFRDAPPNLPDQILKALTEK